MKYDNSAVRRQNRLMEEEEAFRLLETGEYGVLSMCTVEGGGYGIPISYVWDGKLSVYFHCAPEGRKLVNLQANNHVSFCVVGKTKVIPEQFSTAYESVLVFGTIQQNLPSEERMYALELILDKYAPQDKVKGLKYAENSFPRTHILRLNIESISGKCKKTGI